MYVTKMASQYGVVNQGMNQIHRVQFIWYWGFNMLPLLKWWILVICRGRLNCWSSSPFLASMLITVQQWDDIVLKRGAWSCSWTIKKKASKNYCHICGSVKRAIGFLLKRDRRLSNMSLFGNCPICPRDGMRVMEKTHASCACGVCVWSRVYEGDKSSGEEDQRHHIFPVSVFIPWGKKNRRWLLEMCFFSPQHQLYHLSFLLLSRKYDNYWTAQDFSY